MTSRLAVAFDLIAVILCALFARAGCYELFVDVPRVHIARWGDPWGMPKSAITIMLLAAIVAMLAALILIVVAQDPGAQRVLRIIEVGAIVAMLVAWLAWIADFMGSAGSFG
jgi:hypothetical protein